MRSIIWLISCFLAIADENQNSYEDGKNNADVVFPDYQQGTNESMPDTQSISRELPKNPGAFKNLVSAEREKEDSPASLVESTSDEKYIITESDPLIMASDGILHDAGQILDVTEQQQAQKPIETKTCTEYEESYETKCYLRLVPKVISTKKILKTIHINCSKDIFNTLGDNLNYNLFKTSTCKCMFSSSSVITDSSELSKILSVLNHTVEDLTIDSIKSIKISSHDGHCDEGRYLFRRSPSWFINPKTYTFEITYMADEPVYEYVVESDCDELEKKADEGICEVTANKCIEKQETSIIVDGTESTDCTLTERTYKCFKNKIDDCLALREQGCYQTSSQCTDFKTGRCIKWLQTYQCGSENQTRIRLNGDEKPFCLDGSCHSVFWAPNQDMASSISKLSVFREMQKDMDPKSMIVFKGDDLRCSKNPLGYKNCCVKKGWGKKIGLAGCTEDEKKLAIKRNSNKCVHVGSFCNRKKSGICIERLTTYCCFGTKLSRLINEHGRRQLGLSWGSPKYPDCAGLTLSQFTKIDFDKIDFSEIVNDIMSKTKIPDHKTFATNLEQQDLSVKLKDQGNIRNAA